MKTRRLTFYLLREGIDEFDDALDHDKSESAKELETSDLLDGKFLYIEPRQSNPGWVGFVQPVVTEHLDDIRSASTAALLLLKTGGRIFAVTFGFGRSLLNLSNIEYQFGLRVALNLIDPAHIRSLDTKTFEDLVVTTNTQTSKSAELPAFGIDVSKDILRAVTGEPRDSEIATRISGADSLVMNMKIKAEELPEICDKLLAAYERSDYKTDFGWIDQLTLVRDEERVKQLDQMLVGQLRNGGSSSTHLAMPEPIDWQDIDGFQIAGTYRHLYEELDLDEYLIRLGGSVKKITLSLLKSRFVSVRFGRSGADDKRWNLYQCMVSEQNLDGKLFVLIESRWFAVDATLLDEVNRFVDGIPESQLNLVPARAGEVEASYNERLATSDAANFIKLDARIKRPGGATSGIEFCDVFSRSGDLIHVKRKSRSATLSHLFAQGSVSAVTFLNDGYYRDQLRDLIESNEDLADGSKWLELVPASGDAVDQSKYCVTFAVVTNSSRDGRDWLPFFSKLNLMQQGKQLSGLGFKLALSKIPIAAE